MLVEIEDGTVRVGRIIIIICVPLLPGRVGEEGVEEALALKRGGRGGQARDCRQRDERGRVEGQPRVAGAGRGHGGAEALGPVVDEGLVLHLRRLVWIVVRST